MPDININNLQTLSEQGDIKTQFYLGLYYYITESLAQDPKKAVYWWTKAAEQGCKKAQCFLGECYYNGEGIAKDHKEAVYWFTKAAEQGYAKAQYLLGVCYHYGEGEHKDSEKAMYWFNKAAEHDYAMAQIFLLNNYCNKEDVQNYLKKSTDSLFQVGEQGFGLLIFSPLRFYFGEHEQKNMDKAVYWWIMAAEQGDAKAQYKLGLCYYFGVGVPHNPAKAKRLLALAAKQGIEKAKEVLEELKKDGTD
jgi:TPR repeat protein